MKKLSTLFDEGRSELQQQIEKATNREQLVKLLQDRFDDLEKVYIGDLSVAQARLAASFSDTLQQFVVILTAVNETRVSEPRPAEDVVPPTRFPEISFMLRLLQALVCIGVFVSLFSLTPIAWVAILLMFLVVGLEVAIQRNNNQFSKSALLGSMFTSLQGNFRKPAEYTWPVKPPKYTLQVNSKLLLDNLANALNTIDHAVAQIEEERPPLPQTELEKLQELLDLLQNLIGDSLLEDAQTTLKRTKALPDILMNQGIRVVIYQPNSEWSSREYFDFEPSIDQSATDYLTLSPALLKGDRVLRRGRVIEPANF